MSMTTLYNKITLPIPYAYFQQYNICESQKNLCSNPSLFLWQDQYVGAYKMTNRRQQSDTAILNAAYQVTFEPGTDQVKEAKLVYVGLRSDSVPIFANEVSDNMVGRYDIISIPILW